MWANIDSVLDQLRGAGFIEDSGAALQFVKVGPPNNNAFAHRVYLSDYDRSKRRGWYLLHEWRHPESGDVFLVGSYGIFSGDQRDTYKIKLTGLPKMDQAQREAFAKRIKEDQRRAEATRKASVAKAAKRASAMWHKCSRDGHSDYLTRKQIEAPGARYTEGGALVIPMQDIKGHIHGLQFILSRDNPDHKHRIQRTGRDKEFWPPGHEAKGKFHLIGHNPTDLLLVTEGYATGATLHMATGLPVLVAFTAGNLLPAAEAWRKKYPKLRILFCADDDWLAKCPTCQKHTPVAEPNCTHCGEPHKKINTGVRRAEEAALAVDGKHIAPQFTHRGTRKLTDFNDLHAEETLTTVTTQIEAALHQFGWTGQAPAAGPVRQGERGDKLTPIQSVEEMLERFALIYGHNGTAFDFYERQLLKLSDVYDACIHSDFPRRWREDPRRRIVRPNQVGFDPSETDTRITCNLWGGWPTRPDSAGSCEEQLELLRYLCSGEENQKEVYEFVLRWMAYPLQNPGAKMKTALVFHGPQGAGKNMVFESYAAIYGDYSMVVDQDTVEDKYNDWASKKLFLIADEVVARQELYHAKNKLKGLITGDQIRINPKHIAAHREANHVNLVFLSNETKPLVLEKDDRRYTVVWTPPKLDLKLYRDVADEIRKGGSARLHDYLLHLDLKDFTPWTHPPMTRAKQELIELGMDSTDRFWRDWTTGQLPIEYRTCRSEDVYEIYKTWCSKEGCKAAQKNTLLAMVNKQPGVEKTISHFLSGQKKVQQTFIWAPNSQPGPNDTQTKWLTDQVQIVEIELEEWKGMTRFQPQGAANG